LICLFAGLIMVVVGTLAFFTKSYRKLTLLYANAPEQDPNAEDPGDPDTAAESPREAAKPEKVDSVRVADAAAPLRGLPPEIPEARR